MLVRRNGAYKVLSILFLLCVGMPIILKTYKIHPALFTVSTILISLIVFHFSFNNKVLTRDFHGNLYITFSPLPYYKIKQGKIKDVIGITVESGQMSRMAAMNEYGGRKLSMETNDVVIKFRGRVKKTLTTYADTPSKYMASNTAKAVERFIEQQLG